MKQDLSHTEKLYLENQEYEKKNIEEVKKKVKKAEIFRKEHGYSLTMSKLMKKWGCATPEEWRILRNKHEKENYVGPKKEKKAKLEASNGETRRNDYNRNRNNNTGFRRR